MKGAKLSLLFISLLLVVTRISAEYKVTLNVQSMGPHLGQSFHVRVIDKQSGEEVGRAYVPSIDSVDFEIDLYVLLKGHSYRIDYFADHNQNGSYDPPSVDHAWRSELNEVNEADTVIVFQHNTDFTDIGWQDPLSVEPFTGEWLGYWHNWTFDSKGDIIVHADFDAAADSFYFELTTSGIFGFQDTVTFVLADTLGDDPDSLAFTAPFPWQGEAYFAYGIFEGSFYAPDVDADLHFKGNYGTNQFIFGYEIPEFAAEGRIVLMKKSTTEVERLSERSLPFALDLGQNYPNPFNPTTIIPFDVRERGRVRIAVYDILGNEVQVLNNSILERGSYEIAFNANTLPSGVYFYRLQTAASQFTRKMMKVE